MTRAATTTGRRPSPAAPWGAVQVDDGDLDDMPVQVGGLGVEDDRVTAAQPGGGPPADTVGPDPAAQPAEE